MFFLKFVTTHNLEKINKFPNAEKLRMLVTVVQVFGKSDIISATL